ncbi:MAG: hydrogenase iron-sulfur subunit, partial [Candidatus Bathyarchaeia archaeon]
MTIKYRGAKRAIRLASQVINEKMMYLLGLLASDGYIKPGKIRFYNTNSTIIDFFINYYEDVFPNSRASISYIRSKIASQRDRVVIQVKNKILFHIAERLGIKDRMNALIGLRETLISAFLRGYFDGDGHVDFRENRGWLSGKITFSFGDCYDYAYRLHILLKRLGIVNKVYKYGRRAIIDISERRDVLLFAEKVGSNHPEKARRLDQLRKELVKSKCRGGLFEEMPLECGKLLARIKDRYGIPLKYFSFTRANASNILNQECRVTRENLLKILDLIKVFVCPFDEDYQRLQKIANSNIFLDKVKEVSIISYSGDGYVYDITVKGTHSFVPKGSFVVSNCIEGPKMVDVARHPNIEIISFADLVKVEGYIGNFRVVIKKNPRYVIEEKCTGCGECAAVCPIEYPNDWDMNLGVRKAISVPFPQAVPLIYRINRDYCIECYKCVDACGPRQAIDFDQKSEEIELRVGAIVVATGYDIYLPEEGNLYGYGKYSNVITSLEFERLILAAGPTGGHVIRASDGKMPRVVAFIQCVGSRDVNKYPYCSNFCCMYTLKHAIQLKEHYGNEVEVYVFYIDLRSNFKGYEEFYQRAREMGVNFIRGRVSKVIEDPKTKNLIVYAEDTLLGEPIELEAEMVVLATAAVPSKGSDDLARLLNITRGADGFFMESHPKLKPLDTPVDGIFLAGACQGPKDIPYSVAQGCGAAARAGTILSKTSVTIEPIISVIDPEKCRNIKVKCGICAMKCPYGAIKAEPGMPAQVIPAMCHGCGTCVAECPADAITQMHFTDAQILAQIDAALEVNPEEKILGICCNWCAYAGADLAGTSRFEYPPNLRIVRVMCSGRVDRDFILYAFKKGAGMVLVGACHPYDCHYIDGNLKMKVRMDALAKALEKL